MNKRSNNSSVLFATIAVSAAALVLGTSLPLAAQDTSAGGGNQPPASGNPQGGGGNQQGGGGRRGGRGGRGGGAGGFGAGGFGAGAFGQNGGGRGGFQNGGRGLILMLIQRPDVREELKLDGSQSEKIDALIADSNTQQQQMRQTMRTQRQQARQSGQTQTPEQMQAQRDQMQKQFTTFQTDFETKLQDIIGATRMKRLHELELQWQGPLALTQQPLADALTLTPEERAKITTASQDYQTAQRTAMQSLFAGGRRRGNGNANGTPPAAGTAPNAAATTPATPADPATPAAPVTPPAPLTPEEQQAKLEQAQKEVAKARTIAEKAIVAVLTPDQQTQWKQMQGRPFTFRKNL